MEGQRESESGDNRESSECIHAHPELCVRSFEPVNFVRRDWREYAFVGVDAEFWLRSIWESVVFIVEHACYSAICTSYAAGRTAADCGQHGRGTLFRESMDAGDVRSSRQHDDEIHGNHNFDGHDAEGRVQTITGLPSGTIRYYYDGSGNRVMKVICSTSPCTASTSGAQITTNVYDTQGLALEYGPSAPVRGTHTSSPTI
jgi:YD repeat-containing protein